MQKRYKIIVVLTVALGIIGFGKLPDNIKNLSFFSEKSFKEFLENPQILAENNSCLVFDQTEVEMFNQKTDSTPLFSGCGGFF